MEISSAPSVVVVARETANDLKGGRIVFFHIPPVLRGLAWEGEIVNSVSRWLGEGVIPVVLEENDPSPEVSLINELGSRLVDLEHALGGSLISRKTITLSVTFTAEPSPAWNGLFSRLERIYAKSSEHVLLRPVVVFCHGKRVGTMKPSPAVRHRYLWNALRWEDLRSLAAAWLETETTNPLTRAWQISTYTGAANGDPFLLEEICTEAPRHLASLRGSFLARLSHGGHTLPKISAFPKTEMRWSVPEDFLQRWEKGELLGMTIDRGPQIPWNCIPSVNARAYEDRMIWQEQVTSLLPTLLEFTRQASHWLAPHLPHNWETALSEDPDKYTALEPGKVIQFVKKNKYVLPEGLLRLLHALKDARNDLAHMAPLDAIKVQKVWEAFCTTQEHHGRS